MDDLARYARLLRVNPNAELSEIKRKYGEWRQKFEAQLRSDNIARAQKGQRNLALLDQAYQSLAAHAVAAARQEASAAGHDAAVSVEIGSCRVGFSISNLEGFQFVNNRDVRSFKASWPTAKLTFFNNKLKLKALLLSAELEYRHIENIKRVLFLPFIFEIKHRSPDVLPSVVVSGPGFGSKIKRLNDEHHLNLPISF